MSFSISRDGTSILIGEKRRFGPGFAVRSQVNGQLGFQNVITVGIGDV